MAAAIVGPQLTFCTPALDVMFVTPVLYMLNGHLGGDAKVVTGFLFKSK